MMRFDSQLMVDLSAWRSEQCGPFFPLLDPPESLITQAIPAEFANVFTEFGGREGSLGRCFLRLFRYAELLPLNQAFEVALYAPELFIFGSDGGEEAYAFRIGHGDILTVPFVPLGVAHAQVVGNDFKHFIRQLAESGSPPELNKTHLGLDVCARHPLALGGSPTDPANKIMVPVAKHAELARYWNKAYRSVLERQKQK